MGNLKLAHIIAIDKDSGEPVALVCNEHGYIRITLDTETVTVGGSVLPTGAATSAKQDIAKGVLDNIEAGIDEAKGLLGEVQATPTANTLLSRLKAIADLLPGIGQKTAANSMSIVPASDMGTIAVSAASLPLPSGAATSAKQDDIISALGAKAAQVQIEITRPADTTQYAANDAIADNDPSITTHLLSGMARANGGSGRIVRACIKTDNVSWTNAVRVVVYTAAPAGGFIADNAAYDDKYADKASIVGAITFPGFSAMGTGAAGGIRAAVVEGLYIPYACGAGVKDLYFQMYIPSGTPTPASGQKFYLHLGIEQD